MNFGKLKRSIWYRISMRGAGANDPFKQLDRLYMIRDPWHIDSPSEHQRLAATNEHVERAFGHQRQVH